MAKHGLAIEASTAIFECGAYGLAFLNNSVVLKDLFRQLLQFPERQV
jgi:hypothetical protein